MAQMTCKTAGHILMMKQAIIMTIEIQKILSPDLFVENQSILFKRHRAIERGEQFPPIGAVTLIATGSDTLERRAIACGHV